MTDIITDEQFDNLIVDIRIFIDGEWGDGTFRKDEAVIRAYVSQLKASIKEKEREAAKKMAPIAFNISIDLQCGTYWHNYRDEAIKNFLDKAMKAWEEE